MMMLTNTTNCPNLTKQYTGQNAKYWQGDPLDVDHELKDEWLDRLNSLEGIDVMGTCAGHGSRCGEDKYPQFYFTLAPSRARKHIIISDAMNLAARIAERVDSVVTVAIPFKGDPDSVRFQIIYEKKRVRLQEGFGPTLDNFIVGNKRLDELGFKLDKEYIQNKRSFWDWDLVVVYVVSTIVHQPANHDAIEKWWLQTLEVLEISHKMEHR